jgi:membrane-anchored glycerophosphoryl diester phosphodiesterase (GDPDase)
MYLLLDILKDFWSEEYTVECMVSIVILVFVFKYSRYIKVYLIGDYKPDKNNSIEVITQRVLVVVVMILMIVILATNMYIAIKNNI